MWPFPLLSNAHLHFLDLFNAGWTDVSAPRTLSLTPSAGHGLFPLRVDGKAIYALRDSGASWRMAAVYVGIALLNEVHRPIE